MGGICSTYPACCDGMSWVLDEYINQTYAATHHYCYPNGVPPNATNTTSNSAPTPYSYDGLVVTPTTPWKPVPSDSPWNGPPLPPVEISICSKYPDCCGGLTWIPDEYVNQTYAATHLYCYPNGKSPQPEAPKIPPGQCGNVLRFYMDVTQEAIDTASFDFTNHPNTFCCGLMNINCDSENRVTDM